MGDEMKKTKIIALANQKGGVAKSTSTHNLATLKALAGKKTLMIDLDPQGSLSIMCGIEPFSFGDEWHSANDIFEKNSNVDIHECIYNVPATENLYIIPCDIDFATKALELVSRHSREKILRNALKKIEGEYDYIFIDCAPDLGLFTMNGLCCASDVIVPVKAKYIDYRGLDAMMDTIATIQNPDNELNPNLNLKGVIITLFEKNVNDQKDLAQLISDKYKVLGTIKKTADADRNVLGGMAVVQAMPRAEITEEYRKVSKSI